MKLISVLDMIAVENIEIVNGTSVDSLMQRAGTGIAREVLRAYAWEEGSKKPHVLGLVGSGKNGGDTLIALQQLANAGWETKALIVASRPDNDPLMKEMTDGGLSIIFTYKDGEDKWLDSTFNNVDVVLDGILGTGFKSPIKPELVRRINLIKRKIITMPKKPVIFAVDCPSGVDCQTGAVEDCVIPADVTVSMAAVKHGLMSFPAFEFVGQNVVVDIGISAENERWNLVKDEVVDEQMVLANLPARGLTAHKGSYGSAMICGGSEQYMGAPVLAAKGAYKVGTGLVRVAAPAFVQTSFASSLPEAVWLYLATDASAINEESAEIVLKNFAGIKALLLGPGMGRDVTTKKFIKKILEHKPSHANQHRIGFAGSAGAYQSADEKPTAEKASMPALVIDADALQILSEIDEWWKLVPVDTVLTPHPGEMAQLTGLTIEQVQADRFVIAKQYAKKWNCVIVLKGALSVIASPEGASATIPVATSALAKAGTGDVLAGMITGLLAQGVPAYGAAYSAAWLHGRAGQIAAEMQGNKRTPMASDLFESLALVFELLEGGEA